MVEPHVAYDIWVAQQDEWHEARLKNTLCRNCENSRITHFRAGEGSIEVGFCVYCEEFLTKRELETSMYDMECE